MIKYHAATAPHALLYYSNVWGHIQHNIMESPRGCRATSRAVYYFHANCYRIAGRVHSVLKAWYRNEKIVFCISIHVCIHVHVGDRGRKGYIDTDSTKSRVARDWKWEFCSFSGGGERALQRRPDCLIQYDSFGTLLFFITKKHGYCWPRGNLTVYFCFGMLISLRKVYHATQNVLAPLRKLLFGKDNICLNLNFLTRWRFYYHFM